MPMEIIVDAKRLRNALNDLEKKHFATAVSRALNDVAAQARVDIIKAMPRIFDRPTPFTQRSIAYDKATRTSLAATVKVLPIQAKYLVREEIGGARTGAENTVKPAVAVVLPGPTVKLDQYGNVPSGAYAHYRNMAAQDRKSRRRRLARLIAQARRNGKGKTPAAISRDEGVVFLGSGTARGSQIAGYFQRLEGHRLTRLTAFKSETHYHKRFGYQRLVRATYSRVFAKAYYQRLREAIASGR